jgi:hypothetical protein
MKDLIFLDISLDSTFRSAIERSYEELNDATPEVDYANIYIYFLNMYSKGNPCCANILDI